MSRGAEAQARIDAGTWLDHVRTLAWELDRERELMSSRRTALTFALRHARTAGATLGQLAQASGFSREWVRKLTEGGTR